MSNDELVCPSCARKHPASERFCATCGMPLVHLEGSEQPATERQRRARKVKPQYAQGDLVKVARAQNQSEAEFLEGLLLEEGIPSLVRRSPGFDVAESLAGGPRDLLVPESAVEAAREALAWDGPDGAGSESGG